MGFNSALKGLNTSIRKKFQIVEFTVIIGNLDLGVDLNFSQYLFQILNVRICLVSSCISECRLTKFVLCL
jgi:hypothetical protein